MTKFLIDGSLEGIRIFFFEKIKRLFQIVVKRIRTAIEFLGLENYDVKLQFMLMMITDVFLGFFDAKLWVFNSL